MPRRRGLLPSRRLLLVRGQHRAVAVADRQLDRLGQPVANPLANHHAIDHRLDVVRPLADQLGRLVDVDHLAVDPGAEEAGLANRLEHVAMLALAAADHRREDHRPRPVAQGEQVLEDLLGRLLPDRLAALVTNRLAQPRHQQPQVVVDLGHRGHRAPRVGRAGALVDRDRRLQARRSDRRRAAPVG